MLETRTTKVMDTALRHENERLSTFKNVINSSRAQWEKPSNSLQPKNRTDKTKIDKQIQICCNIRIKIVFFNAQIFLFLLFVSPRHSKHAKSFLSRALESHMNTNTHTFLGRALTSSHVLLFSVILALSHGMRKRESENATHTHEPEAVFTQLNYRATTKVIHMDQEFEINFGFVLLFSITFLLDWQWKWFYDWIRLNLMTLLNANDSHWNCFRMLNWFVWTTNEVWNVEDYKKEITRIGQ